MHPFARVPRALTSMPVVTALLAAVIFASQVAWIGNVLVDDAYISFSFSKNLALGHGPVYAHGLRVEGYSNFLWVVLLAVPLAFERTLSPMVAARVLAALFAILLGWASYSLVRRTSGSRLAAAAAVLLLAASTDHATAFLSGLETLPYAALLTFGFLLWNRSRRDPRLAPFVVPTFVATALMRIDGLVPLVFVLCYEAARRLLPGQGSLRAMARWALPGLAAYGAWFLWRWHYYGLPLPSTYYAKALIPVVLPMRGIEYVLEEVASARLVLVFPAIGLLLWRRRSDLLPMMLFVLGHLAYVAQVGGDWMPFGRFVLPVIPLALALEAAAAVELVSLARARGRAWTALAGAAGVAGAVAQWLGMDHRLVNSASEDAKVAAVRQAVVHVQRLRDAARYLRAVVPPGGRLVTDYGGVLAYETEADIIEMWGLCNAMIATHGGTAGINPIYGRTCPECYRELDPQFFHVEAPLVRKEPAFAQPGDVLAAVWQSADIGKHIDLRNGFVVGRVRNTATGEALYFLQKRSPQLSLRPRPAQAELAVDYPFEGHD
jgi:arabinofuranosyltransferase